KGTHLGVRADAEGLLLSGGGGIGATWMNAEIGDAAVTPRQGRAIEINALWYNALRIAAEFAKRFHHPVRSEELFTLANRARAAFNRRFWNDQTGCCFDVVADTASDGAIRPNQLLAISLPYPILNIERHAAAKSGTSARARRRADSRIIRGRCAASFRRVDGLRPKRGRSAAGVRRGHSRSRARGCDAAGGAQHRLGNAHGRERFGDRQG